jgi:hypothetical protein
MYQHFSTMPYVYTVMLFCLKLFTTFDIHAIRGHVQYMLLSYKLFTASRQSEVIDLGPRVIGDHLGGFHGFLRESNERVTGTVSLLFVVTTARGPPTPLKPGEVAGVG